MWGREAKGTEVWKVQGGDKRGVVLSTSSRWRCGNRESRDRPLEQEGGCWGRKRAFCEVTLGGIQTRCVCGGGAVSFSYLESVIHRREEERTSPRA